MAKMDRDMGRQGGKALGVPKDMGRDKGMNMTKEYAETNDNAHYLEPSMYGTLANEQYRMQPVYAEPGECGGDMQGEHRNVQAGP